MASSSINMPALVPLGAHAGKPPILLKRPVMLIGSRSNAHLHLLSRKVSKAHAVLINSDGRIYIRDLASRTHVIVNDKQVREADLQNGDQIRIGSFLFRLLIPTSWVTSVHQVKAKPAQLEVDGVDPVHLTDRVLLIGRRPNNDISLLESSASTAHAIILEMAGKRFIRDLGSRTGTFLNGRAIHQEQISFGDVIKIGETEFHYGPASATPSGPVAIAPSEPALAEAQDADFAELEDLVGTAPLAGEPADDLTQELEQELSQRSRPAQPPVPQPRPQPPVVRRPSAPPAPEPEPARKSELELEPWPESTEPPVDTKAIDPTPVARDPKTSLPRSASQPRSKTIPVSAMDDDATIGFADDTAPSEPPAGVDELELSPAKEVDESTPLSLDDDDTLEAPVLEHDPEATRAMPAMPEPTAWTPPSIADQMFDLPLESIITTETAEPVEPIKPTEPPVARVEPPIEPDDAPIAIVEPASEPQPKPEPVQSQAPAVENPAAIAPPSQSPNAGKSGKRRKNPKRTPPVKTSIEETLDAVKPNPESAQALTPLADPIQVDEFDPASNATQASTLTDTTFGREMREFSHDLPEPIEETAQSSPSPLAAPVIDQPLIHPPIQETPVEQEFTDAAPVKPAGVDEVPPADDLSAPDTSDFAALDLEAVQPATDTDATLDLAPDHIATAQEISSDAADAAASFDTGAAEIDSASAETFATTFQPPHTVLPPSDQSEVDIGTDETLAAQPAAPLTTEPLHVPPPHHQIHTSMYSGPVPPPPAKGRSFGKKPVAAALEDVNDAAQSFAAGSPDALPRTSEVDIFSQLGTVPPADALLGHTASVDLSAGTGGMPASGQRNNSAAPALQDQASWVEAAHELGDELASLDETHEPVDLSPDADKTDPASSAVKPDDDRRPRRPVTTPVAFEPAEALRKKKRRWFFSIPFLLMLMLLVMGAAVGWIWTTVPVVGTVQGWLRFDNLPKDATARTNFYEQQRAFLNDSQSPERSTRVLAIAKLQHEHPGIQAGFLADSTAYALMVDQAHRQWLDSPDGRLELALKKSFDPSGDGLRMHALLVALYQQNQSLLDQQQNAQQSLSVKSAKLASLQGQIEAYQQRLDSLVSRGVAPLTAGELKNKRAQLATLEQHWRLAEDAVRRAQGDIERMREAAARTAGHNSNSDSTPAIDDSALKAMEQQAAELHQKLDAQHVADTLAANNAQKQLDDSIASLEAQLQQVMKQMQDVPEMRGYLTVARLLQDTVNRLTTELLHDQKQQLQTISELKRKLDEQLIARQNEVWANDPDLKNYADLLEIQQRRRNAAIGSGDHPGARQQVAELDTAIARLQEQIDERRQVLGNDQIYAQAITGLKDVIAQSEQRLSENEKRTEQEMARLHQALAEAAPDLDKLPQEQKKLAGELERRIVAMQIARKQYITTLSSNSSDNDQSRRTIEAQLLALQGQMDNKRQALLAQQRQNLSDQEHAALLKAEQDKARELTGLQETARTTQDAYLQASRDLAGLENRAQNADEAIADRARVMSELQTLQDQRTELKDEVARLQGQVASAIIPLAPTGDNVIAQDLDDQRSWYALITMGSIALLFGVMMMAAHHANNRTGAYEDDPEYYQSLLFPTNEEVVSEEELMDNQQPAQVRASTDPADYRLKRTGTLSAPDVNKNAKMAAGYEKVQPHLEPT